MRAPGCSLQNGGACRQTRTIPTQIRELKAELPKPDAEGNRASSPLDQEISELEQVCKQFCACSLVSVTFDTPTAVYVRSCLLSAEAQAADEGRL